MNVSDWASRTTGVVAWCLLAKDDCDVRTQARGEFEQVADGQLVGTTQGARTALNDEGFSSVSVMPHVIFWSSLYDGFRRTMGATPKAGVDREFQVNPGKPEQFIDAALQLVQDGADMLLLEPAMFTADVLTHLKQHTRAPLFPFSVSGEYTALSSLDPKTGKRDVRRLIELFTMLKRAGAEASVTYAALEIARQLSG